VPLLVFRCAPIITPYLEEDDTAGVFVEAFITHVRYNGAAPIPLPAEPTGAEVLDVSISLEDGSVLAETTMRLNSTSELYFPLVNLSRPRKQPFNLDCTALYASQLSPEVQTFSMATALSYLPRPPSGSATKRDSRTGALLVKPPGSSSYEAIFPIGFYTSFDGYLDSDLGILDELKAQG
jgi:hypothetical protein